MKKCNETYTSYLSVEWDLILHAIGFAVLWCIKNYEDACCYLQNFKETIYQFIN